MARRLTPKQFIFCEAYLETLNGTEAARRAYAFKSDAAAAVGASRLLRIAKIRAHIDRRLADFQMDTNEVLFRLSQQARVSIADFFREEKFTVTTKDGNTFEASRIALNWDKIRTHGHLIKSVKNTRDGPMIELHDAQIALIQMGKRHGLFTEKVDIDLNWRVQVIQLLQNGRITPEQVYKELGDELAVELFEQAGIPVVIGTPGRVRSDQGETDL